MQLEFFKYKFSKENVSLSFFQSVQFDLKKKNFWRERRIFFCFVFDACNVTDTCYHFLQKAHPLRYQNVQCVSTDGFYALLYTFLCLWWEPRKRENLSVFTLLRTYEKEWMCERKRERNFAPFTNVILLFYLMKRISPPEELRFLTSQ